MSSGDLTAWSRLRFGLECLSAILVWCTHTQTQTPRRPLKLDKRNRIMLVEFWVFNAESIANQGVEQSRNTPELTIHVIKWIQHKFQHDSLSCHTSRVIKILADKDIVKLKFCWCWNSRKLRSIRRMQITCKSFVYIVKNGATTFLVKPLLSCIHPFLVQIWLLRLKIQFPIFKTTQLKLRKLTPCFLIPLNMAEIILLRSFIEAKVKFSFKYLHYFLLDSDLLFDIRFDAV